MSLPTGVINLDGIYNEQLQVTMLVTGAASAALAAALVGKAVSMTSTNNTVQLAADNGVIFGYCTAAEFRMQENNITVATISLSGIHNVPIKTGEVVVVGGSIQGAGSGEVKPLASQLDNTGLTIENARHDHTNMVLAVNGLVATVLFK